VTVELARQWASFENADLHQRLIETVESQLAPAFDWKTDEHGVTSGLVFGTTLSAIGPPVTDSKKANQVKSNILHALKASGAQPSMLALPDALGKDLLLVSMGVAELRIWWPNAAKLNLPIAVARLALAPGSNNAWVADHKVIAPRPASKDHPSIWSMLWNLSKGASDGDDAAKPIIQWLTKENALPAMPMTGPAPQQPSPQQPPQPMSGQPLPPQQVPQQNPPQQPMAGQPMPQQYPAQQLGPQQ
jgi:hypothetical protein